MSAHLCMAACSPPLPSSLPWSDPAAPRTPTRSPTASTAPSTRRAEVMPLNVGGADGTATVLRCGAPGGDGKSGCNLTGSTSATFSLDVLRLPSVATVSPGFGDLHVVRDDRARHGHGTQCRVGRHITLTPDEPTPRRHLQRGPGLVHRQRRRSGQHRAEGPVSQRRGRASTSWAASRPARRARSDAEDGPGARSASQRGRRSLDAFGLGAVVGHLLLHRRRRAHRHRRSTSTVVDTLAP